MGKGGNTVKTADIVIVGAGLSGMSTAYYLLQEDPNLRIAIVDDRRVVGTGSTRQALGMVRQSFSHPVNQRLAAATRSLVSMAIDHVEHPVTLRAEGALMVWPSVDGDGVEVGPDEFAAAVAQDLPVEWLTAGDLQRWPHLEGIQGRCCWIPSELLIETLDLVDLFWFAVHGSGRVEILPAQAVTGLEAKGSTVTEIKTTKESLQAGQLLLAAGMDILELCAMLPYEPPLEPLTYGAVSVTGPEPVSGPVVMDWCTRLFVTPAGPQVVFGGRADEPPVDGQGEWNWDVLAGFVEGAQRVWPALAQSTVQRVWMPKDLATPDGVPLAGRVPGWDNVWLCTGFNGSGVSLIPGTAQVLAKAMAGGDEPLPTALDRFTSAGQDPQTPAERLIF